jgi:hypothetical protein
LSLEGATTQGNKGVNGRIRHGVANQTWHNKVKGKVKVTLEQATKAQRRSRGIAPHFL